MTLTTTTKPTCLSREAETTYTFSTGRRTGSSGHRPWRSAGGQLVTTADFNSDGKPDVASSNFDLNNIAVLLNQGGGVLDPTYAIAIPQQPMAIFSGDFNRDGRPDVGTINFAPTNASGGMLIAINNGNGFNPAITYYNGGPGAFDGLRFMRSATVADVTEMTSST